MRFMSLLAAICFLVSMPATAQTSLPTNLSAKKRLEFRIKPEEIQELRSVLVQFAHSERLTVNDIGAQMPPRRGRPLFHLDLDQDDSIKVTVTNIRAEERMFVWFYELQSGSNLAEIDSKLEHVLSEKWPTLAPYEGS
jgi:hypothetical protein